MLKRLGIKNIGLISDLSVTFGRGLNIITGETGAGKSMVLSALNLILGERADLGLLRDGEKNAAAEAVLDAKTLGVAGELLEEQGIFAEDGEFVIRRTLQNEGKSRAFVNGSVINISALKSAGETMVDIHGQHDHQALLRKETHLPWLDHYLGIAGEASEVSETLKRLRKLEETLAKLEKRQKEMEAQKEFLEFKADELEKADLKPEEEGLLEIEHSKLANAEKIKQAGMELFDRLYDSDTSALSELETAAREMESLARVDPFFKQHFETFRDIAARISDACMEIQSHCSSIEDDPAKLEELEARQALIEKLKNKYKEDVAGLLRLLEETRRELDATEYADEERENLTDEITAVRKELLQKAVALHKKRVKGVASFKKEVQRELKELNMPTAVFEVDVLLTEEAGGAFELDGKPRRMYPHGFGEFQFLFSANEGQKPKPLVKIASGGEISRVMLALTREGLTREEAYAMVQKRAMQSWKERRPFRELVSADPEISAKLGPEKIEELFDLNYYLRKVDEIFGRVFS